MKKALFLSAIFACLLTSCMKNTSIGDDNGGSSNNGGSNNGGSNGGGNGGGSSNTSYHVSATIDGKSQSFTVSPIAVKINNAGLTMVTIQGAAGTNANNASIISASWTSLDPSIAFATGTYSDASTNIVVTGTYNPSIATAYISLSPTPFTTLPAGTNHYTLTITAFDSKTVKGTFSGDVFLNGDASAAKKTLTYGDFYVPWQ